jgi:ABC-type dipeptide/oligopeptide/nickel transport system permease component
LILIDKNIKMRDKNYYKNYYKKNKKRILENKRKRKENIATINWEEEYKKVSEINDFRRNTIKKIFTCWQDTLDHWEWSNKIGFVTSILSYIMGILFGIGIAWSFLR